MITKSWSHYLVQLLMRPLVATPVTPNHITTLRVITGAIACLGFAWGSREAQIWGGMVWILSAFLDRADGELARLSNRMSAAGHHYDWVSDIAVNAALFLAIGIGLRHQYPGIWSITLGLLCGVCLILLLYWCEVLEESVEPGTIVLDGAGGFDPDDLFYFIGPLAWAGQLGFVLISGSFVLPPFAAGVGIWLWRARQRQMHPTLPGAADRG